MLKDIDCCESKSQNSYYPSLISLNLKFPSKIKKKKNEWMIYINISLCHQTIDKQCLTCRWISSFLVELFLWFVSSGLWMWPTRCWEWRPVMWPYHWTVQVSKVLWDRILEVLTFVLRNQNCVMIRHWEIYRGRWSADPTERPLCKLFNMK